MRLKEANKKRSIGNRLTKTVFALSKDIRYVAVYQHGRLESVARPDLAGASSWESDKYEEIIVNPTLITLLQQRGEIDCGGMRYVIIRYGNFTQFVHPVRGGHISVAFEPDSNYSRVLPSIQRLLGSENLADETWDPLSSL